MRYILLIVIFISVGYAIGYRDAREHDKSIVERIVDHVQNANNDNMNDDADKKLEEIQRK
jgi:hypothetical protein